MECNSVCVGIKQFLGNFLSEVAFWAIILLVAVSAISAAISAYEQARAKSRAKKMEKLESEIQQLFQAIIEEFPSPKLTSDGIPQRFPTKKAAQAFGESWSRGNRDSFTAKAVDASGYDENHPRFDKNSVGGGILYATPALFFGMKEAHKDSDTWWLAFLRAKQSWLANYLDRLRNGATSC
jgi:hypothetical protein